MANTKISGLNQLAAADARATLEGERAANALLTAEVATIRAKLAAAEARAQRLAGAGSVILQHYDGFKARNGHIDDTVEMAALRAALAEGAGDEE